MEMYNDHPSTEAKRIRNRNAQRRRRERLREQANVANAAATPLRSPIALARSASLKDPSHTDSLLGRDASSLEGYDSLEQNAPICLPMPAEPVRPQMSTGSIPTQMHREPAWPAVLNRRGAEVREREAAVSTALLPRIGIDTSTASSDIVVTPQEPEQTAETQEQTTQVYGQDRVPSVEQKAQNRSSSQLRRGPPRPDSLAKYGGRLSTPDASIDLHDSLGNIIRQQHNGLSLMRSAEPHFAAQMRRLQSGTLRESLVREFDRSDGDGNVLLEFVYKEAPELASLIASLVCGFVSNEVEAAAEVLSTLLSL